jgi:hypothetical protein
MRSRGPYTNKTTVPRIQLEEETTFEEGMCNGGMVTVVDPTSIQNNQFINARNAQIRYDRTQRRQGFTNLTPTKPNSTKVLGFFGFRDFAGQFKLYRFTKNTIHLYSSGSWTAITAGAVLTGTDDDRFTFAAINNQFFFANGVDPVQEINVAGGSYAALGNAEEYKYICGFYNRIVGANLGGASPNPIQIGWSGDTNFAEWDGLVDLSAGSSPLIDSPSDFADNITGLFGFDEELLVLRERSLWSATKQPVFSNPFYFRTVIPNIGCDSPATAVQIPSGIAWYDRRTRSAYAYRITPGAQTGQEGKLQKLSFPVETTIAGQIVNEANIFAGYDPYEDEYYLVLPSSGSAICRVWVYSFKAQAWTYWELNSVSCVVGIDFASGAVVVNDLLGKINDLVGVVNDLSDQSTIPTLMFGKSDGDILQRDLELDSDATGDYTYEVASKLFRIPTDDLYVAELRLDIIPRRVGAYSIYYTKDGENYNLYKTVTIAAEHVNKRITKTCRKHINTSEYGFKITATSGLFDLIRFEIGGFPGARTEQTQ